jgi:hypothetical protein
MSSTTGDHINEFEARRLKREARRAASNGDEKPPRRPVSAEQARNLFGGLITNGSEPDANSTAPADNANGAATQTNGKRPDGVASGAHGGSPTVASWSGEGVDDLVRRVKAGAQTAAADAATVTRQRRPTGTADLAPDAATRKRAPELARRRAGEAAARSDALKRRVTRALAAAVVLIAVVVLAPSFGSAGGRRAATTHGASLSSAALARPSVAGFGDALRTTAAAVDRELQATARRATARVKHARPATKHHRVRPRRPAAHTRQATSSGATPPATVQSSSTTSSQTQNYAPPPSAGSGQGSTAGASSSSSQPAGPTNAGPLGGIGSCVKGC